LGTVQQANTLVVAHSINRNAYFLRQLSYRSPFHCKLPYANTYKPGPRSRFKFRRRGQAYSDTENLTNCRRPDNQLPDFYRYTEWAREFDAQVKTNSFPTFELVRHNRRKLLRPAANTVVTAQNTIPVAPKEP
jgi:hypothetical protein